MKKKSNNNDQTALEEFDYYQFQSFNLGKFELPITLMIPDETAGIGNVFEPEIIHDEGGHLWSLQVGRNFTIEIEDMGEIDDFIKDQKESLKNNKILKYEIIRDQKDVLIYSREISTGVKKNGIEEYFIFAKKSIDGRNYSFRNSPNGNTLNEILYMEKAIQSIKPNAIQ